MKKLFYSMLYVGVLLNGAPASAQEVNNLMSIFDGILPLTVVEKPVTKEASKTVNMSLQNPLGDVLQQINKVDLAKVVDSAKTIASTEVINNLVEGKIEQIAFMIQRYLKFIPDSFLGLELAVLKKGQLSKQELFNNADRVHAMFKMALSKLQDPQKFVEQLGAVNNVMGVAGSLAETMFAGDQTVITVATMLSDVSESLKQPLKAAQSLTKGNVEQLQAIVGLISKYVEDVHVQVKNALQMLPDTVSVTKIQDISNAIVKLPVLLNAASGIVSTTLQFVTKPENREQVIALLNVIHNNIPANIVDKIQQVVQTVSVMTEGKR